VQGTEVLEKQRTANAHNGDKSQSVNGWNPGPQADVSMTLPEMMVWLALGDRAKDRCPILFSGMGAWKPPDTISERGKGKKSERQRLY
jgi:hypothetical protein